MLRHCWLILIACVVCQSLSGAMNTDSIRDVLSNSKDSMQLIKCHVALGINAANKRNSKVAMHHLHSALYLARKTKATSYEAHCMSDLAMLHKWNNDLDSSQYYYWRCLSIYKAQGNLKRATLSIIKIGGLYTTKGMYIKADSCFKMGEKLIEGVDSLWPELSKIYWLKGSMFLSMKNNVNAIHYYSKSLKLNEDHNNTYECGGLYHNIAILYFNMNDYKTAEELYIKSREINLKTGNKIWLGNNYLQLSEIYLEQKKYKEAYNCAKLSANAYAKTPHISGPAFSDVRLGKIYYRAYTDTNFLGSKDELGSLNISGNKSNLLDSAILYLQSCLDLSTEINFPYGIAAACGELAKIHFHLGDVKSAFTYMERVEKIAKETNNTSHTLSAMRSLAIYHDFDGDNKFIDQDYYGAALAYQNAYDNINTYFEIKDTLYSVENYLKMSREATGFEFDKKEAELIKEEEMKRQLIIKEKKLMSYAMYGAFFLGFVMLIFFLVILNRFKIIKRQKSIIQDQHQDILEKNIVVESKNKQITDSITYAQRIQTSLLPTEIKVMFPNSAIIYYPKDIVSGDFYWCNEDSNYKYVAVSDCTGHGVPGAFMSVLGISLLDKIVNQMSISDPEKILDQLSADINKRLQVEGESKMSSDGMDISLMRFHKYTSLVDIASAGAVTYAIKEGNLIEFIGDVVPIGLIKEGNSYKRETIELNEGDQIIAFSDGIVDQMGGELMKKYGSKRFKELISSIKSMSIDEQKKAIESTFFEWKKDIAQLDDICVVILSM